MNLAAPGRLSSRTLLDEEAFLHAQQTERPRYRRIQAGLADGLHRDPVVEVAAAGDLGFHDVVVVDRDGGEGLPGATDVSVVARPTALVLVAAYGDVTDEDMAVVEEFAFAGDEFTGIEGQAAVLGQIRQGVPGQLWADEHARMMAAGSDTEDVRGIERGADSGTDLETVVPPRAASTGWLLAHRQSGSLLRSWGRSQKTRRRKMSQAREGWRRD